MSVIPFGLQVAIVAAGLVGAVALIAALVIVRLVAAVDPVGDDWN